LHQQYIRLNRLRYKKEILCEVFLFVKTRQLFLMQHLYLVAVAFHQLKAFLAVFIIPEFGINQWVIFIDGCPGAFQNKKLEVFNIQIDGCNGFSGGFEMLAIV